MATTVRTTTEHSFRRVAVCGASAACALAVTATPALASDFSGLASAAIFMFGALVVAALLLAALTAAFLFGGYRRKSIWFMFPVFAILWFTAIFGSWQLWLNWPGRDPAAESAKSLHSQTTDQPVDIPAPEGIDNAR